MIRCPNEGCISSFLRKDLEDHLHDKCQYRLITCTTCAKHYRNTNTHECSKCEYCEMLITRDITHHFNHECTAILMKCCMSSFGCPWKGTRNELFQVHQQTCPFEQLRPFIEMVDKRQNDILDENRELRNTISRISHVHEVIQNDLGCIRTDLDVLANNLNELNISQIYETTNLRYLTKRYSNTF